VTSSTGFEVRIRATYEAGQTSYLDVLLSSDSYTDILTKLDIIESIVNYDQKQLENLAPQSGA
jgi:peptidoglycan hydrolase CwlO-like protein